MDQNFIPPLKCRLVDTVFELGLSTLAGAIIVGRVAIPNIVAVATTGWDAYTVLLWGLLPLTVVAGWMVAVIYHVKYQAWPFMR